VVTHPADVCTYTWGASGGSFNTQGSESSTWTAPIVSGHYNLWVTVTDQAVVPAGEGGSRTDGTLSFSVGIDVGTVWQPGGGINCAGLTAPAAGTTVATGDLVTCQVAAATDNDTRIAPDGITQQPDSCTYAWSAASGSFTGAVNSLSATWITPGSYVINVHVADQAVIPTGDGGDRNDPDLDYSITVMVVKRTDLHVDWTRDFTTSPPTRQATRSGTVGGPATIRVRLKAAELAFATLTSLTIKEDAGHLPQTVVTNRSLTETSDPDCNDPAPGDPNGSDVHFFSLPWATPSGHNGAYTLSASINFRFRSGTDASGIAIYTTTTESYQIQVNVSNLLITNTTPTNPAPVNWDPAAGTPATISATVECAYRASQPVKLSIYSSSRQLVRTLTQNAVIGTSTTIVPVTWNGQMDGTAGMAPKGVYLFQFAIGDTQDFDTDMSALVDVTQTDVKIIASFVSQGAANIQAKCVVTDAANPREPARRTQFMVIDPDLSFAGGGTVSDGVTNAVGAPSPTWTAYTTQMRLRNPGTYVYLFSAQDKHAPLDKGHRERWGLQLNQALAMPAAYIYQFDNYPSGGPSTPRRTADYGKRVGDIVAGPLAAGPGAYIPKVRDNQPAGAQLVTDLKTAGLLFTFGHGGVRINFGGAHSYVTFWTGSSWSALVQTTDARDDLRQQLGAGFPIVCLDTDVPIADKPFKQLLLGVFEGCHTALAKGQADGDHWGSPAHALVARGAACAVGFSKTIYPHKLNNNGDGVDLRHWSMIPVGNRGAEEWAVMFWEQLSRDGATVQEALQFMRPKIPASRNLGSAVIAGNGDLIIVPARTATDADRKPVP